MFDVTVWDFLSQWTGDFRIEDESESVLGEFRENLTDELKNMIISNIRIERTMWTKQSGEMIIIV